MRKMTANHNIKVMGSKTKTMSRGKLQSGVTVLCGFHIDKKHCEIKLLVNSVLSAYFETYLLKTNQARKSKL